ncbi:hypothetical protein NDU88_003529, partial [Pleurodeles waltl]
NALVCCNSLSTPWMAFKMVDCPTVRDLRRSMASSLRAAEVTGAVAEVPGAKVMPTLLGERA